MNKTTLYTITGFPYAGKTTLRNELIKRFGFSLISIDDIMNKKDMWREGHPTQEDWNEAYSEAYKLLKKLLISSKSVIFDGASLKFKERETQRLIANGLDVEHKLIYINTSKDEILKRQAKNFETKERGHLDDKELKTAFDMFEEPKEEENPVIYNSEIDLNNWIKDNIRQD